MTQWSQDVAGARYLYQLGNGYAIVCPECEIAFLDMGEAIDHAEDHYPKDGQSARDREVLIGQYKKYPAVERRAPSTTLADLFEKCGIDPEEVEIELPDDYPDDERVI